MLCAIHQLHYLPWLRYFHKIAVADIFVVLDNIQFNKNGWQNRNKIKTKNGWMYLTIPVHYHLNLKINEIKIDNSINWQKKHLQAIKTNYSKAPFFKNYFPQIENFYLKKYELLWEICWEMLQFFLKVLNIKTKVILNSNLQSEGIATDRLINICKKVSATSYLSGEYASKVYLDIEKFKKENLEIFLQKWEAPIYKQLSANNFIKDLSIIDLLFNEGEKSLFILIQAGKVKK